MTANLRFRRLITLLFLLKVSFCLVQAVFFVARERRPDAWSTQHFPFTSRPRSQPKHQCRWFSLQPTTEWTDYESDSGESERYEEIGEEKTSESDSFLAAIEPGAILRIQIGDVSLARKAWKKRRRNKSPLLVPCSVINTKDALTTVQQSIVYLLKKFGSPRMSLAELSLRHRTHLRSTRSLRNLLRSALEREDVEVEESGLPKLNSTDDQLARLLLLLFPQGNSYRVVVKQNEKNGQWSCFIRDLSYTNARKQAKKAAVVQLRGSSDASSPDGSGSWEHTGFVRTKSIEGYRLQPLSAALRLANHQNGELLSMLGGSPDAIVNAYVWDFDVNGDAGSPMLTLSLSPLPSRSADAGNATLSVESQAGRAPFAQ